MSTTQTPGAGARGEVAADTGHHEHVDTRDNVGDPDVLGWFGLEYDGPRCAGDDCRAPVDNDGELCDDCGDQPHQFQPHDPPRWPNWCACGRIRAAREHSDELDTHPIGQDS